MENAGVTPAERTSPLDANSALSLSLDDELHVDRVTRIDDGATAGQHAGAQRGFPVPQERHTNLTGCRTPAIRHHGTT